MMNLKYPETLIKKFNQWCHYLPLFLNDLKITFKKTINVHFYKII